MKSHSFPLAVIGILTLGHLALQTTGLGHFDNFRVGKRKRALPREIKELQGDKINRNSRRTDPGTIETASDTEKQRSDGIHSSHSNKNLSSLSDRGPERPLPRLRRSKLQSQQPRTTHKVTTVSQKKTSSSLNTFQRFGKPPKRRNRRKLLSSRFGPSSLGDAPSIFDSSSFQGSSSADQIEDSAHSPVYSSEHKDLWYNKDKIIPNISPEIAEKMYNKIYPTLFLEEHISLSKTRDWNKHWQLPIDHWLKSGTAFLSNVKIPNSPHVDQFDMENQQLKDTLSGINEIISDMIKDFMERGISLNWIEEASRRLSETIGIVDEEFSQETETITVNLEIHAANISKEIQDAELYLSKKGCSIDPDENLINKTLASLQNGLNLKNINHNIEEANLWKEIYQLETDKYDQAEFLFKKQHESFLEKLRSIQTEFNTLEETNRNVWKIMEDKSDVVNQIYDLYEQQKKELKSEAIEKFNRIVPLLGSSRDRFENFKQTYADWISSWKNHPLFVDPETNGTDEEASSGKNIGRYLHSNVNLKQSMPEKMAVWEKLHTKLKTSLDHLQHAIQIETLDIISTKSEQLEKEVGRLGEGKHNFSIPEATKNSNNVQKQSNFKDNNEEIGQLGPLQSRMGTNNFADKFPQNPYAQHYNAFKKYEGSCKGPNNVKLNPAQCYFYNRFSDHFQGATGYFG